MRYLALATILILSVGLVSCRSTTTNEATTKAVDNRVHVDAYINVTSGCQQPTVDLLNRLAAQYSDRIALTLTDFGSDEGFQKWQATGLRCMAIRFDGSTAVVFDAPYGAGTAVFQQPPGLGPWSLDDLEHAMASAAVGKLRPATDAEVEAANTPRKFAVKFAAQQTKDLSSGKTAFELTANGKPVAQFTEKEGDTSPHDRAVKAAKALNDWVGNEIVVSDLKLAETAPGRVTIEAAGAPVMAASDKDTASAGGEETKKLASKWVAALKGALLQSAANKPPEKKQETK